MFFLRRAWRPETKRSDLAKAWLKVASTPEGLLAIHDLASRYHVLSAHGGDGFSEGQRSVVLHILAEINLTTDELTRMRLSETEAKEEE